MTAIIYNFSEELNKYYVEGKVPLEYVIRSEMLELGYDPNSKEDVLEYWADCRGNLSDE
jgi:hypothetical protein